MAERDVEILALKDSMKSAEEKTKATEVKLCQSSEREEHISAKLRECDAKVVELQRKLQETTKFKDLANKNDEWYVEII